MPNRSSLTQIQYNWIEQSIVHSIVQIVTQSGSSAQAIERVVEE